MLLDKTQVMKYLPHRDPFLFVDAIESVKDKNGNSDNLMFKNLVGIEVVGLYKTEANHNIFAGHFPGNPILPGVVQVEMMGQTACFAVCKLKDHPMEKVKVALLGITSAKFRKPIFPNMHLVIKSKCVKTRGPIMSFDSKIYCDDILMSESTFLASLEV